MLVGNISYKGVQFDVYGVSTDTSLSLYLKSKNPAAWDMIGSYTGIPMVISITDLAVNVPVRQEKPEGSKRARTVDKVNDDFYITLAGVIKQLQLLYATGTVIKQHGRKIIKQVEYKGVNGVIGYHLSKVIMLAYAYGDFKIDLRDQPQLGMTPAIRNEYYTGDAKKRILYNAQAADRLLEGKTIKEPTKKAKTVLDETMLARDGYVNINLFHHTLHDVLQNKELGRDAYQWIFERNYQIVTPETMESTLAYLTQFPVLAVDTETTGLKFTHMSHRAEHNDDKLVGIVLSGKEGESFYFPLGHEAHFELYNPADALDPTYDPLVAAPTSIVNLMDGNVEAFLAMTKDFFERKSFITFNALFDWKVFYAYHIKLNVVFDVLAAFMLTLTAKEHYTFNSLAVWTERALDRIALELDDYSRNGKWTNNMAFSFKDLPYEMVRYYACPDADNTLALYNYIMSENLIREYASEELMDIETKFMLAAAYQEFYGHYIPLDSLTDLKEKLTKETKEMFGKFIIEAEKTYGIDVTNVNLNSPAQTKDLFYKQMKLPEQIDSKTNKPSTSKTTLGKLLKRGIAPENQDYPILGYYFAYRDASKHLSDFTVMLDDPDFDGYAYSRVKQFLNTGRLAVSKPNYQSYSDTAKKYVRPRPGYYMMDYDYNSIESRVIASMSGEPYLLEAFEDLDIDYHKLQAAKLFNKPYESVDGHLRQQAKALNFGIPYGLGDQNLGENIFGKRNDTTTAEAAKLKAEYFKIQPHVAQYFRDNRAQGVNKRYTNTHFGRRRYYPVTQANYSVELASGNHPIQGTAADMYKNAVGLTFERILAHGLEGKILFSAFVHDESLLEVAEGIHPAKLLRFLRPILETRPEGFVPILIGCGFGHNWYDAKENEVPTMLQQEIVENPEAFYPNWPAELPNLTEVTMGYVHEHELKRIAEYVTDPENEGKVIKAIIFDYYFDKLKRANIKEDETVPLTEMLLKLWDAYDLDRYAPREQIVNLSRPADTPTDLRQEVVEDTPEVKMYKQIEAFKVSADRSRGELRIWITPETRAEIITLIKELGTTRGNGLQVIFTSIAADGTYQRQLVKSWKIAERNIPEFTSRVVGVYR